jgi:hypothetical protein
MMQYFYPLSDSYLLNFLENVVNHIIIVYIIIRQNVLYYFTGNVISSRILKKSFKQHIPILFGSNFGKHGRSGVSVFYLKAVRRQTHTGCVCQQRRAYQPKQGPRTTRRPLSCALVVSIYLARYLSRSFFLLSFSSSLSFNKVASTKMRFPLNEPHLVVNFLPIVPSIVAPCDFETISRSSSGVRFNNFTQFLFKNFANFLLALLFGIFPFACLLI